MAMEKTKMINRNSKSLTNNISGIELALNELFNLSMTEQVNQIIALKNLSMENTIQVFFSFKNVAKYSDKLNNLEENLPDVIRDDISTNFISYKEKTEDIEQLITEDDVKDITCLRQFYETYTPSDFPKILNEMEKENTLSTLITKINTLELREHRHLAILWIAQYYKKLRIGNIPKRSPMKPIVQIYNGKLKHPGIFFSLRHMNLLPAKRQQMLEKAINAGYSTLDEWIQYREQHNNKLYGIVTSDTKIYTKNICHCLQLLMNLNKRINFIFDPIYNKSGKVVLASTFNLNTHVRNCHPYFFEELEKSENDELQIIFDYKNDQFTTIKLLQNNQKNTKYTSGLLSPKDKVNWIEHSSFYEHNWHIRFPKGFIAPKMKNMKKVGIVPYKRNQCKWYYWVETNSKSEQIASGNNMYDLLSLVYNGRFKHWVAIKPKYTTDLNHCSVLFLPSPDKIEDMDIVNTIVEKYLHYHKPQMMISIGKQFAEIIENKNKKYSSIFWYIDLDTGTPMWVYCYATHQVNTSDCKCSKCYKKRYMDKLRKAVYKGSCWWSNH